MFATTGIAFSHLLSLVAILAGAFVDEAAGARTGAPAFVTLTVPRHHDRDRRHRLFLPAPKFLPSHITRHHLAGVLSRSRSRHYAFHFAGAWRWIYAVEHGDRGLSQFLRAGDAAVPEGAGICTRLRRTRRTIPSRRS
jgi:hypothetical protein